MGDCIISRKSLDELSVGLESPRLRCECIRFTPKLLPSAPAPQLSALIEVVPTEVLKKSKAGAVHLSQSDEKGGKRKVLPSRRLGVRTVRLAWSRTPYSCIEFQWLREEATTR